jgi:hypothetical protein
MGQEPAHGSRTQDRNDNGDQENTERHALPDRMGGRSARKPEPPSWIPRHGNSARNPPKQLLTLGKLSNKLVTTAILRRKHRVELGRKHQLENFEWLNDPVLHVGRRTVSAKATAIWADNLRSSKTRSRSARKCYRNYSCFP